jgi:hypothetical protein
MREKSTITMPPGAEISPMPGMVLNIGVLIQALDQASSWPELTRRIGLCEPELTAINRPAVAEAIRTRLERTAALRESFVKELAENAKPGPHIVGGGTTVARLLDAEKQRHHELRVEVLGHEIVALDRWLRKAENGKEPS